MNYDGIIIGGGIAGLQAAVQLGRYGHKVLVIDAGYGRSTLCARYHNVLGFPDGVSGEELRKTGRKQAQALGVEFADGLAIRAAGNLDTGFRVGIRRLAQQESGGNHPLAAHEPGGRGLSAEAEADPDTEYTGSTLLLATGVMDRFPELPGLRECLGHTIYVCPDCDSHEVAGRRTVVLGAGDPGARMALTLRPRTDKLTLLNHERKPISPAVQQELDLAGIQTIPGPIAAIQAEEGGRLVRVQLEDGRTVEAERGFLAFGGNAVHSDLAVQLGAERMENRHVLADPRSKETNIPGVYAAGDIGVHAEQLTVAMGEGAMAAIWMNKAIEAKKRKSQQG
ncbi:NAD(P)/FAD-dependent oxidoreductase [Paenibacillus lutrae]|uniref:NAD(P)-binding protein n=1 Tax=Paenibacillus lutrae TaxID=2078573 RepID=A0A7X3JYK3_9BACL|nr:NAD(P)/FAD-dependent oxidoreductase [Paenibacillus lutrae]MVO99034.1 NAD(P)-binding protein [Paenibacillus lutrae]